MIFVVLTCANSILFIVCRLVLKDFNTRLGPAVDSTELLVALAILLSVGFSIILTVTGVISTIRSFSHSGFYLRQLIGTLIASVPLLAYFVEFAFLRAGQAG